MYLIAAKPPLLFYAQDYTVTSILIFHYVISEDLGDVESNSPQNSRDSRYYIVVYTTLP